MLVTHSMESTQPHDRPPYSFYFSQSISIKRGEKTPKASTATLTHTRVCRRNLTHKQYRNIGVLLFQLTTHTPTRTFSCI